MRPLHDRYCNESHTPRQPCNDALAPIEMQSTEPIEPDSLETETEPTDIAALPDEPPMSSAVREAVAVAPMPPPSPYVTREWERTAAAVSGARSGADDVDVGSRRGGVRWIAIVGLAAAVMWVLVRTLRAPRKGAGVRG